MSPHHKGVRILGAMGLVIGLAAVGWVARQALQSPRPEHGDVDDVVTTRVSTKPAPDPALLRLRQQAGEVLTGRPSRLARQMPGASPELVAWLERWEQRTDAWRSNERAMLELASLISGSTLDTYHMTRLSRSMALLDKRMQVAVVWVQPITCAAERDLALLEGHPEAQSQLAMQVFRAVEPAIWEICDYDLRERFMKLMVGHLPEKESSWQWMAANLPLSIYLRSIRSDGDERPHSAHALLAELLKQDLSRWGPHPRAELYYVAAILSMADGNYEAALRFSHLASEPAGYHHAKEATWIRLEALSRLGRVQEVDEVYAAASVRFRLDEQELVRWAEMIEISWGH